MTEGTMYVCDIKFSLAPPEPYHPRRRTWEADGVPLWLHVYSREVKGSKEHKWCAVLGNVLDPWYLYSSQHPTPEEAIGELRKRTKSPTAHTPHSPAHRSALDVLHGVVTKIPVVKPIPWVPNYVERGAPAEMRAYGIRFIPAGDPGGWLSECGTVRLSENSDNNRWSARFTSVPGVAGVERMTFFGDTPHVALTRLEVFLDRPLAEACELIVKYRTVRNELALAVRDLVEQ